MVTWLVVLRVSLARITVSPVILPHPDHRELRDPCQVTRHVTTLPSQGCVVLVGRWVVLCSAHYAAACRFVTLFPSFRGACPKPLNIEVSLLLGSVGKLVLELSWPKC